MAEDALSPSQRRGSRARNKPQPMYDVNALTAPKDAKAASEDVQDPESDVHESADDSEEEAVQPPLAKKARGRPKKAETAAAAKGKGKAAAKSKPAAAEEPEEDEPDSSEPESDASDMNVDDLDDARPSKKRRGSGGAAGKPRKKAGAKAPRKKKVVALEGAPTDNTLFEAARGGSAALAETAREWTLLFGEDEEKALIEVMNCILLTAGGGGGSGAYSPPDDTTVLDMSAEQWSDLFTLFVKDLTGSTDPAAEDAELVDSDDDEAVAAAAAAKTAAAAAALEKQAAAAPQCYLLLSDAPAGKAKAWKAFAANYAELWRRIGDAASAGGLQQEALLQALFSLLITMQSAPLTEVRLSATAACLELGAGLVEARSKAEATVARVDRQKAGIKGAAQAGKAKVLAKQAQTARAAAKLFAGKIEELFLSVVAHRHRDVSPAIRAYVVTGLAQWGLALPTAYASNDQIKYLGWGLHDTQPIVRRAALEGLTPLYELAAKGLADEAVPLKPAMLKNFTGRFAPRILAMTTDKSSDVSLAALKLLRAQLATQLLDDMAQEYLEQVYRCVFDDELTAEARSVALAVYIDSAEAFNEDDDSGLDDDTRAAAQLTALTELIGMHAAALSQDPDAAAAAADDSGFSEIAAAVGGADMLVEAAWTQPLQREALLQWDAALKLLGGSSDATAGEGFDEADRTALMRIVSTTVAALELDAAGGRSTKAAGRVSVADANKHLDAFAAALLPALPSLIGAAMTEPQALALLAALPAAAARRGAAALTGKRSAVLGALKALRSVLDSSAEDAVLSAAAAGFGGLLSAEHGCGEGAEKEARHLLQGISDKIVELCPEQEGDEPIIELSTDDEVALSLSLLRLRHIVGRIEPWQRVQFQEVWSAVKAAVLHRADLDAAPFPGTTVDSIAEDDDDDADNNTTDAYNTQTQNTQQQQQQQGASQTAAAAAQSSKQLSPAAVAVATRVTVLREGASLLVNGFVWQYSDVLRSVSEAAEGKRDKAGGDGAAADDAEEVEDESDVADGGLTAAAKAACASRDDVLAVLSALLSMHLVQQQRTPTEAGSSLNGSAAEDQQLEEVPRTVSLRAKRALTAVQSHAYMLANNLRAPLRASMLGVAYLRQLAWTPDARFTSLLQAHFEAREAELEAVLHDETEPPVDGASLAIAYELLQPLMVGIWSNADQLNKRQAAVFVGHFIHSGPEATELVKSFITHLKARNPIHFLEVLMATLMVLYDKWITSAVANEVAQSQDNGDEQDELEEKITAAEAQGFTMWLPLAKRLAQTIGVGSNSLHGKMKTAFQMFMSKGVRTALDDPPNRLCFLEGLMPFTHFLTPAQRGYVLALLDDGRDNFPEEVQADCAEAAETLENNEPDSIARQWRAFFAFRHQIEAGSGGRRIAALPKSPAAAGAAKRRKSVKTTKPSAKKTGTTARRSKAAAAAADSDNESDDDYKANGRTTVKRGAASSGSARGGRGRGRGRGASSASKRASAASDLASVAEDDEHNSGSSSGNDSSNELNGRSSKQTTTAAAKRSAKSSNGAIKYGSAGKRKRVQAVREEAEGDVDSDVSGVDSPPASATKRSRTAVNGGGSSSNGAAKKPQGAAARAAAAQSAAHNNKQQQQQQQLSDDDAAAAGSASDGNNSDSDSDGGLFDDLEKAPAKPKRRARA